MISKFTNWLIKTDAWGLLLRGASKLNKKISGHPASFPMSEYHSLIELFRNDIMSDQDVLVFATTDVRSVISRGIRYLTKGHFNHAGFIVFSDNGFPQAFHVTTDGLVKQDLLELLRNIDYICINKLSLTEDNYKKAEERFNYLSDISQSIKYDYNLMLENGDDKFYCSEASFFILDGLYDDIDLKPEMIYGIKVFPPSAVTRLGEIIYTNHPLLGKKK